MFLRLIDSIFIENYRIYHFIYQIEPTPKTHAGPAKRGSPGYMGFGRISNVDIKNRSSIKQSLKVV
jgi:hypothetical protein